MEWGDQWNRQAMDYLLELGPNMYFKHLLRKLSIGRCLVLGAGGEVSWVYTFSKNIEEIVGINISREELQKSGKGFVYLVLGDAQMLPFNDSCFNVIICKSTLHHLADINKAILEMQRVLCKGGSVIFYEPGALNFIAMIGRKFFPTDIHVLSERPFVPTALKEMLSKLQFNIVDEGYFFLITHLFPILGKYIPLFKNFRLLKAVYHLDMLLCKSGLKQFCWIMIYAVRRGY